MSIKLSDFIIVNGHQYPAPKYYPNFQVTTATNAARNAANKVVGQKRKSLRPHCCKGAVRPDGPAPL